MGDPEDPNLDNLHPFIVPAAPQTYSSFHFSPPLPPLLFPIPAWEAQSTEQQGLGIAGTFQDAAVKGTEQMLGLRTAFSSCQGPGCLLYILTCRLSGSVPPSHRPRGHG